MAIEEHRPEMLPSFTPVVLRKLMRNGNAEGAAKRKGMTVERYLDTISDQLNTWVRHRGDYEWLVKSRGRDAAREILDTAYLWKHRLPRTLWRPLWGRTRRHKRAAEQPGPVNILQPAVPALTSEEPAVVYQVEMSELEKEVANQLSYDAVTPLPPATPTVTELLSPRILRLEEALRRVNDRLNAPDPLVASVNRLQERVSALEAQLEPLEGATLHVRRHRPVRLPNPTTPFRVVFRHITAALRGLAKGE